MLFTPVIQLETLFILNEFGRIVSTREPNPSPGPRFSLIRGQSSCAWAVHADVPEDIARQTDSLAPAEPPLLDFQRTPLHEREYLSLLGGTVESGPVFTFPDRHQHEGGVLVVERVDQLQRHFGGWTVEELPERAPIVGILEGDDAVSVCFCARKSTYAAEAGLETAEGYRGRGLGPRATTAWALAIRASGLLPLYSTSWQNKASLSVARKLRLSMCATDWNVLAAAG